VGIDLSPNMVHEYNTMASNQSKTSLNISATVGNLLDPADPSPAEFEREEFYNFDIAVVGLGFHHLGDPVLAATKLAARLKKGGVLVIVDFFSQAEGNHNHHGHGFGKSHGHNHGDSTVAETRKHLGFGEQEMKKIFDSAGVGKDFGFEVIAKEAAFETSTWSMISDVFMARGTKAETL
jgi:SAM-dependent methyltransferase